MLYLLVILGLLLLGGIAWIVRIHRGDKSVGEHSSVLTEVSAECCGAHEICDSESLLTLREEVEYYSDEELDVFKGIGCNEYTAEQIEQFRDVLLTLQVDEVAGWLKSIQLRGIFLPDIIREEALMIVQDFRSSRARSKEGIQTKIQPH